MRFYACQHRHYCGIDLHVQPMYVCILDATGQTRVHRNVKSTPEAFLEVVAPYREDLVVAAECMFTWHRGNGIALEAACPRGSSAMSTVAIVDSIQLWLTMTGRMP